MNSGYSMIEMALVLVLAGLAALVALPTLGSARDRQLVKKESMKLASTIELLVAASFQSAAEHTLVLSEEGYEVIGELAGRRKLPLTLQIESAPQELSFYRYGVVSPATVALKTSRNLCLVIVSLRGRVRVTCPAIP